MIRACETRNILMANDPGYHRAMSLHLARTLDEIGLNTLTVKKRRYGRLCEEQIRNVYFSLIERNVTVYHFGSQTEGATTLGMESDLDTLQCFHKVNVLEDWVDWRQGKENLLMLYEGTAPGYCRLQLLRSDVPMAREDLPSGEHLTYDSTGRVIRKNTSMHSTNAKDNLFGRSGPARTRVSRPGIKDTDMVYALKCNTWPVHAAEFTTRRRRHGWPSPHLLEEAVSHGVFLVPAGYKLSPTEPLEWRISASLAERCLMFSLNIVHIKCYVVLKILVKTFIAPRIQNCLSSYHCKTALLHCTENTEPSFWREDNLILCITRCLEILRHWISDLFCPQFMIREENLFAGKVTIQNRDVLLSILTELIRSNGLILLRVSMDDIGIKLQTRLNTEPSCVSIIDSWDSVMLLDLLERNKDDRINDVLKAYLLDGESKQQLTLVRSVYQNVCSLKESVEQSNKHERKAHHAFSPLLSCLLGSLLASFSLFHQRRVPRQAIQLMSTAAKYDVASILKLASVIYCSGKFDKAKLLLQTVEAHFRINNLVLVCSCYDKPSSPIRVSYMMHIMKDETRAKLFAHCLRFSRHEIHCAPPALCHEIHRSIGDDLHQRELYTDNWMVLATVDCLPYLYYLQYLTYRQLGKHDLQKRALYNLDCCIKADHDFRHLETAWNLLGQCLEDEQDPNAAMACYRTSLEIRPRNNAANWHVAVLWYKLMKFLGLLPGVAEHQTEK